MIPLQDPSLLRTRAYVDGTWVDAAQGATLPVLDPASGEQIATVPAMGGADALRAVAAAAAAWPDWRARTAKERAAVLRRWHELMLDARDDLARVMTREQGKPLAEAAGRSPTRRRSSSGSRRKPRARGETLPVTQHLKRILVLKQPVGVWPPSPPGTSPPP